MRLKDPFSLKTAEMTKRSNKPKKPREEESSDEVSGLTCQHVSKAVELNSVKKAVTGSLWFVCSDCLRERDVLEAEQGGAHDILVCLKCGFQGCCQSERQHSVKHQQAHHSDSHCISISLSTWKAWCFECNEELSTHCNKKALAQTLDFLQKHSAKSTSGSTSKLIKLIEEPVEYLEPVRGKSAANSTLIPVKGIVNLGNTCFFNAVMQNLSQTHMLNDLIQEVKEKGHKMKICPPPDTNLGLLTVTLACPEPLTSAMMLFLCSMKEAGKGPVSPKVLFTQLCQKAPRFKGYQQQDSQELLHYLLDSVRMEENKRIKAAILKAFNNPTEKTADEETKRQVKAYGKEGVKMNFVDRIFVGELTNTIMCEECEHISTVKEAFIDISLPIIEERISKPSNSGRLSKPSREQESPSGRADDPPHSHSGHDGKKPSVQKPQVRRSSTCQDPKGREQSTSTPREDTKCSSCVGSQSDGSDKDSSPQDSSNDADSEASESECSVGISTSSNKTSSSSCVSHAPSASSHAPLVGEQTGSAVEQLVSAVSKLGLVHTPLGGLSLGHGGEGREREREKERDQQGAFQALSHSYTPASKECSVQSCLHQFTSIELLMGNNKLLCENCTEKRHRQHRRSGDKKVEKVYTSARKQMLISQLPPVVTLHLKRFHQAGMNLRKVNRHVDFPLVLDLAPFCSASCKNQGSGERVLYSLYGIVEHSGSMRGGHYTAYVKVRTPQRKCEQLRSQSGCREAGAPPPGQWVYVSDTSVQTVPESRVLNSQAYLLFYEELL
ncbi:ubiquitin carboxyl-terminal hydrolase 45 [Silurus meridionalis]|uniref:ubiquitin carboxyl-terminal hydrolase 45 n=1 Tax=Silurus meridionalis TaxID=175797 RepID=UPI001EEC961D|nr:ubiquitin carboxyl-terminal hydrolase 45 [Silurus meridionalis]XP_046732329.1 ubiquitin carboxyl-terminal hydrolase 45 [Silurus meridionalis]